MTLPVYARKRAYPGREYAHPYTDEPSFPSVTNITGHKDKSGPLVGWACKHAGLKHEAMLEAWVAEFKEDPSVATKMFLKQYSTKKGRGESAREVKNARFEDKVPGSALSPAEAGTAVHQAIEDRIAKRPVIIPQGLEGFLAQFDNFCERFNPTWQHVELTVWNRTLRYAGTLDALAVMGKGRTYLLDFKTGGGVYPEYAMQLEALRRAEFYLDADGNEIPLEKTDAMGVLHIRPDFWEIHEVREDERTWKAFLGLLEVRKWDQEASHQVLGARVRGEAVQLEEAA